MSLETYSDKRVLFTGDSVPRFGIVKGQYYDKVMVNLLTELQTFVDKKVELKCLYDNTCDNCDHEVLVPKAVQTIIDKLCVLSAKDIIYDGAHYCIGDTSISSGAVFLLGKNFRYSVEPAMTGSSVSYDLTDIIRNLPADYRVGRINTVISGKPSKGKSIILDSNKSFVGATIPNDRYPINIDIDMRINTPTGDVKMTKSLNVPSPLAGNYTAMMDVQDFGTDGSTKFSLETFLEQIAAQTCSNKTEIDSLNEIDLPGCESITYESKRIKDILSKMSATLCSIDERLKALETISFSITTDGCGATSFTQSCGQAIGTVCGAINNLSSQVRDLSGLGQCQGDNCG